MPLLISGASGRVFSSPRRGIFSPPRWMMLGLMLILCSAAGAGAQQQRDLVHTWKRIYYGKIDGRERLLFGGRWERLKPALGDLDGDGDEELLVGGADGRILFFENRGTAKAPEWRLIRESLSARTGAPGDREDSQQAIDVGENAAPVLVDLDGDGDLDLLVGAGDGRLHLFRNEGNRFLPVLRLVTPDLLGRRFGGNLAPRLADFNGDGLPDLLFGTAEGVFFLLINQGSRFSARFCVQAEPVLPNCLVPPQRLGSLEPQDNAVPAPVDWDGDGDLDIVVGKSDGKLAYYRNIGTSRRGTWELAERRFLILDAGGYAAPFFRDLNGDRRPDLLLAGDGERMAVYINRPGADGPELWRENRNVLKTVRLGRFQSRLHVASGDWDGDGDSDLVIGTRGGQLLLYENVGGKGEVALRSLGRPLLPTPQRSFSAPALVDLDGDGDLDLLVGGRNGRLELIENRGTPQKPAWRVAAVFFQQIDVGAFSTPAAFDIDGSGSVDLLVGNSLGNVVYFTNRGSRKRPLFAVAAINFAGMKVAGAASPAFFRYDPKVPPDLVVGTRGGRLNTATRNPALPVAKWGGYQAGRSPWQGIAADGYSAPHFVDLTGDGRQDLLLGGNDGSLAAWRYEGSQPRPRVVSSPAPSNVVPDPASDTRRESAAGGGSASAVVFDGRPGSKIDSPPASLDPIFVAERGRISALRAGRLTRPVFFDADGDGVTDLVVGTARGELRLFRNGGPAGDPRWAPTGKAFAGYRHGRNPAPVFYDIDGDGDRDLVVGNEQGRLNFWENTGSDKKPDFKHRPGALKSIRAGKNAVPAFWDLDGDGVTDLLVGNLRGWLLHYRQRPGKPVSFELVERRFLDLDVGVNASPTIIALGGDNRPVLLVGSDRGPITVIVPENRRRGRWRVNKSYLEGLRMPAGSHPALADLDGDGDLDLFVGSDRGPIHFFRNNALLPEPGGAPSPPPR
ncbi:MAG: VCBS repeat-containing protein [bacterium]